MSRQQHSNHFFLMSFALIPVLLIVAGCGSSISSSLNEESGFTSRFTYPYGVAVDASANLYVADAGNNAIRMITPAGRVTPLVGVSAGLAQPAGVTVDKENNYY